MNGKRDLIEDTVTVVVVETHLLHVQPDNLTFNRLSTVFHARTRVDKREDALYRRLCALCDNQKRCQYAGRAGQHSEKTRERNEGSQIDAPIHYRPAAIAQQDDLPYHR
ncbi:Uncharacterised protein [Salmonella enterica subsp. enterica serovar Bovismorbificans]|uniref:Uncharacterized protein n=1 Tax=Salmonella enterica subsp. enterica serovar Bovismorbificans TaxID=58097 RepID=A0A655CRE4_SALET|nr:Uncharacterised protein [Salmonella enterica subsp. enterica serovar Bovismorbificans]CNV22878.1 Uncharacterised protein [Salmonella enterica subsp. enterica serovar Bovismorbificans]CNV23328.1 Uncharacterised protein [Salmonella enterica subsp. enterica serovar Bovismorbificans]CPR76421.1 Uncharacterised protein [Salmonella enterica subsp. enterica serovar Bovismorbificans]